MGVLAYIQFVPNCCNRFKHISNGFELASHVSRNDRCPPLRGCKFRHVIRAQILYCHMVFYWIYRSVFLFLVIILQLQCNFISLDVLVYSRKVMWLSIKKIKEMLWPNGILPNPPSLCCWNVVTYPHIIYTLYITFCDVYLWCHNSSKYIYMMYMGFQPQ